jgi:hypothetical protein
MEQEAVAGASVEPAAERRGLQTSDLNLRQLIKTGCGLHRRLTEGIRQAQLVARRLSRSFPELPVGMRTMGRPQIVAGSLSETDAKKLEWI